MTRKRGGGSVTRRRGPAGYLGAWLALAGLALVLTGCRETPPTEVPVVCTMEFRYGLGVRVKDSLSGAWIASGSTIVVRDGTYADSVVVPANRPDLDAGISSFAGERAGSYSVSVRRAGYTDWLQSTIVVTKDECHVKPVGITAQLRAK